MSPSRISIHLGNSLTRAVSNTVRAMPVPMLSLRDGALPVRALPRSGLGPDAFEAFSGPERADTPTLDEPCEHLSHLVRNITFAQCGR